MGLFSDLKDGIKTRLNDPPKYKSIHHPCHDCSRTGDCSKCHGDPPYWGQIIGGLLIFGGIALFLTIDIWFMWPSLMIVLGITLYFSWERCDCLPSSDTNEWGACRTCEGRGYTIEKVRDGGTGIIEAIDRARKSSLLVKNAFENGNMRSVENEIQKALAYNSGNFAANAIMGALQYDKKKYERALKYLLIAENIKPKNLDVKQFIFIIYDELGNSILAEQKKIELMGIGINNLQNKQMAKNIAAAAVGGIVGVFIGSFIPFLDD